MIANGHPPANDNCWRRIGVWGDRSCPELKQHVHCRNCPVFNSAAATLFDRSLPAEYAGEWTRRISESRQLSGTETASAVIFRVGKEYAAIPTAACQEVSDTCPARSLPHRHSGLHASLVNVQGELLIQVELQELLGLENATEELTPAKTGARKQLLIVGHDGKRMAFLVDEVCSVHVYRPADLRELPATVARTKTRYTRGVLPWRNQMVGYLDEHLLIAKLSQSLL